MMPTNNDISIKHAELTWAALQEIYPRKTDRQVRNVIDKFALFSVVPSPIMVDDKPLDSVYPHGPLKGKRLGDCIRDDLRRQAKWDFERAELCHKIGDVLVAEAKRR